ncbi:MAG: hypothetical protein OXC00_09430 [Acidimicrobiaceae bacterium]|nr:hypothetical protein [Acidimicrobiaceae bacterium]
MTAPAHSTAAEVVPAMPGTADPQSPAASAVDAPARTAPSARAAAGIGRRAWEQFADNPLTALFGTAIVALLIFNFTTLNARIDDTNARIDDTNARITRLEERMETRFAALEEDVAEINLKLTALIAALNRTDEVDAALEGRLIDDTPIPDPAGVPSG